MEVTLTPEAEKILAAKVSSGRYQSAGDVLSQALHMLDTLEDSLKQRYERLKLDVQIGDDQVARGEVVPFDVEAIKAKGRQLIATKGGE